MTIPKAVSPSQLTPGMYLVIDLLAGTSSPGGGVLKTALVATQSGSEMTDDTEVRTLTGTDDARVALGAGSVGALAAELIYNKFPAAVIDAVSPVAGATPATLDIVFAGVPTANNAVSIDLMGREFEISWLVGEDLDDMRDKLIAAINQRTNSLAVTATSGGAGTCTITSDVTGFIGDDILVKIVLTNAATGTEDVQGAHTGHTNLVGGTTDPDLTNALAAIAGKEYHYIVVCLSNTDIADTSANNLSKIKTHIDNLDEGLNAKLQQCVVGFTGLLADAIASAPHSGSAGNSEKFELLLCVNGRSMPGEFSGREAGGRLAAVTIDPAANRIGEILDGVVGSWDIIADRPTLTESEQALGAGVSLVGYTAQDAEQLIRAVTTHSQDDQGGADRRLLDVQNVDAEHIVMRDLRDNIPLEFPQAKIQPDHLPGEDLPPPGVLEEKDVKSYVITRLRAWQRLGVILKAYLDEAIADGTLIVRVDSADATQVNIVVPKKIIQPWAKTSLVGQRVPS